MSVREREYFDDDGCRNVRCVDDSDWSVGADDACDISGGASMECDAGWRSLGVIGHWHVVTLFGGMHSETTGAPVAILVTRVVVKHAILGAVPRPFGCSTMLPTAAELASRSARMYEAAAMASATGALGVDDGASLVSVGCPAPSVAPCRREQQTRLQKAGLQLHAVLSPSMAPSVAPSALRRTSQQRRWRRTRSGRQKNRRQGGCHPRCLAPPRAGMTRKRTSSMTTVRRLRLRMRPCPDGVRGRARSSDKPTVVVQRWRWRQGTAAPLGGWTGSGPLAGPHKRDMVGRHSDGAGARRHHRCRHRRRCLLTVRAALAPVRRGGQQSDRRKSVATLRAFCGTPMVTWSPRAETGTQHLCNC